MFTIPDWLDSILNALNWDILTFHVYVGDALRNAINWLLSPINSIAEWAISVSAFLSELMQEIRDALAAIGANLGNLIAPVIDWFTNLPGMLAEWWAGVWPGVLDAIDTVRTFVLGVVDTVWDSLTQLWNGWTEFLSGVLPWLADKTFVDEAIRAAFGLWADLFNLLAEVKGDLIELFNDPEAWLLEKISRMIERFL